VYHLVPVCHVYLHRSEGTGFGIALSFSLCFELFWPSKEIWSPKNFGVEHMGNSNF
jgi:hypothetical protein